jgi:hypothetical protein
MRSRIQTTILISLGATFLASAQTPFYNRTLFQTATPAATNVIDFREFELGTGQGTGFIGPFTELGFVRFNTNANFSQEIIDGYNVGQPGNNVYTTLARDKSSVVADITFARGVAAVGFDLKNTANASTTGGGSQTFFATFLSCSTNLGTFPIVSPPGGTTFQFFGLASTNPITEVQFSSENVSPNLDLVLDDFAVAPEIAVAPIPLLFDRSTNGLILSWANTCAFTLQSASEVAGPYTDVAGATSPSTNSITSTARYFRLVSR